MTDNMSRANANIVPIIAWSLLDILLRPTLLNQVMTQINNATDSGSALPQGLQMPDLLANPLLQSIYAEELRLRFAFLVTRTPLTDNFQIGGWRFPKGDMILASTWHAHRDNTVWNEGPVRGESHPVDHFWAERFLVYPDDPASGPRKSSSGTVVKPKVSRPGDRTAEVGSNEPKFTTESVAGSWFPYGGGAKLCPGRFYAKQEAIGGVAMFLSMFEIELKQDKLAGFPQPDMSAYPFGVLAPKGRFPARMRKRKQY